MSDRKARATRNLALLAVMGLLLAAVMCGCGPQVRYVPVESVRTEYRDKVREVHTADTVTDTRFVYVKGDTVIDYRDRVRWRDRFIHDTCAVIVADSVPVPYPVEKPLSRWEQVKMDFGGIAIGALALALCAAVAWIVRKFIK